MAQPPDDAPALANWQALRAVATERGRPFLPIQPADLEALRAAVDLTPEVEALLREGTPVDAFDVGGRRLLPTWSALVERLGALGGWPRRLLPIGEAGPGALVVLDLERGRVARLDVEGWAARDPARPLPLEVVYEDPRGLLRDLRAWVECVPPGHARAIRAFFALRADAWAALERALGRGWNQRWLFANLRPLRDVRETLVAERRVAAWAARVSAGLIAAAPLVGWWLGGQVDPPQPWLGVGLAVLVLGGVPMWLLAHARSDAASLGRLLTELPPE